MNLQGTRVKPLASANTTHVQGEQLPPQGSLQGHPLLQLSASNSHKKLQGEFGGNCSD